MQAVILCAGKGTRMGELTLEVPKPLLTVKGKTLLEHKLDQLPEVVTEIILIVGYLGGQIREKIGTLYHGRPVHYVEDPSLTGTAHALWKAKDILQGRFLVMMGDDVYDQKTLEQCTRYDFAIACKKFRREETGSRILLDETGNLINFVTHKLYLSLREDGGLVFTGLYSLTTDIFTYEPVKMETKDEWGLPQTLLKAAKDHPIAVVETNFWIPINKPDDLRKANSILRRVRYV